MWNPLASLPPSNAGALSSYAPGPIMTPGGGGTGAPLQPGQMPTADNLHPIYSGFGSFARPAHNSFGGHIANQMFSNWMDAHNLPQMNPGMGGPMHGQQMPGMGQLGSMGDPNAFRSIINGWMTAPPADFAAAQQQLGAAGVNVPDFLAPRFPDFMARLSAGQAGRGNGF